MNKSGKDLAFFLAGIAMCAGGLFLFLNQISVSTGFLGGRISYWGLLPGGGIPGGMVVIPLIIGIVMLFFAPKSVLPKIICCIGMLFILLSVIASTTFHFERTSAFNYILMMVLIFGGFAMIMRILILGSYEEHKKKKEEKASKE